MASESSSAMLDMNDADTEDTEAQSVTEDHGEGAPLIMEQGLDIAVKVSYVYYSQISYDIRILERLWVCETSLALYSSHTCQRPDTAFRLLSQET